MNKNALGRLPLWKAVLTVSASPPHIDIISWKHFLNF